MVNLDLSKAFALGVALVSSIPLPAYAQGNTVCRAFPIEEQTQCFHDFHSYGGLPTGVTRGHCIEIMRPSGQEMQAELFWLCLGDGGYGGQGEGASRVIRLTPMS